MTEQHGGSFASPFEHASEPEQPPKGSVIAYQRMAASGVILDYVSFRAGDGHWYTTGEGPRQRVSWSTLWVAIRTNAYGAVRYATAWAEMDLPRPVRSLPGVPFVKGDSR